MAPLADNRPRKPTKPPGLIASLLWYWPWQLLAMVLVSLFLSILMEYAGMLFIYPGAGASHSQQVMATELGYLSRDFRQSILLSEPVVTINAVLSVFWQWAVVDSGLQAWINAPSSNGLGQQIAQGLKDYCLAALFVTMTTLIRLCILLLSVPLFLMVSLVALVEGLSRRDLRRYGAAYESSFVWHHARRLIKPAFTLPCLLYLSWPAAVYPNLLLLPGALLLGVAISVSTASFKKYL